MKAISLRGIRDLEGGQVPLPDESMVEDGQAIEALASLMKAHRNYLLRQSDWTLIPDNSLIEQERIAWMEYRHALREFPQAVGFPLIPWPTPPALRSEAGSETGEQT